MIKKLYLKTFGCQMNEYDSEKIVEVLSKENTIIITLIPEEADIIIFNTCSIREKAEEKVFSDLGRIRKCKTSNPKVVVAVGGCVASQEGDNIIKRAPYVDVVFGPQTLHRLPELMLKKEETGKSQIDITFPQIEKFDTIQLNTTKSKVTAFVSIMEGCSKYCSYCIVPYTRGEEISRPLDSILNEIRQLLETGVKEVTLLGQNVNAYFYVLDNGTKIDFATLLEKIHDFKQLERIRFVTSHPKEMTTRVIECYRDLPKLVSHLHLPVQSGSDKILMAMKRGYSLIEYKSIIKKIRHIRPNISFSSDFIIGFPNETVKDFEDTMALINEVNYDTSYSFIYSKRPGTPAAFLSDNVSLEEKKERLQQIQHRLADMAMKISRTMVGTVQKVLVEAKSVKDITELTGRTDNAKVVNFTNGNSSQIGTMVDVLITEARINTLRGELV